MSFYRMIQSSFPYTYTHILSIFRTIITNMNFSKEQIDVPLFILTDGSDREHSILMGTAKNNGWCTRYKLILEDTVKNKNSNIAVKDMVDSHHRLSHINPINVSVRYCIMCKQFLDKENRSRTETVLYRLFPMLLRNM